MKLNEEVRKIIIGLMKKYLFLLIIITLCVVSVFAEEAEVGEDEFLKEILISDVPVVYGDENFRERILARTEGKRDPIGLVLTGGSARACAHIGVLKYLDEIGLEPDYIVSNSMGSIIGMLYAAGVTPSEIEEILNVGDISSYFSLNLPSKGGFLSADGFKALIEYIVGKDYRLEDTKIPVMVVCDDLVSKREVRITEGSFSEIMIGSFALPVYFSPYMYNGHLLIDGGVISLAPIDAAYEYSDTVILSTTFYDADTVNLLNPVTVLNSSFDIGKRQKASSELKKYTSLIWIRCDVEKYSFMAFSNAAEMAQIGYESAKALSDELNGLYKSNNKVQAENDIPSRIEELKQSLGYFGRIKASSATSFLGIDFVALNSEFSPHFLKNSMTTGIKYDLMVSNFNLSVLTGFGSNSQNLSSSEMFMTLGGEMEWFVFPNLRTKIEGYVDFLRPSSSFYPFINAKESIDYYIINGDRFSLSLQETIEYAKDYNRGASSTGVGSVLAAIIQTNYQGDNFSIGGDAAYLLTSDGFFTEPRNYLQGTVKFGYDLTDVFYTSVSLRARFSVDGKGSVPVFVYDNYTSQATRYGASALRTSSSLFNIYMDARAGMRLLSSPTFGEFLMFDNTSYGIYFSSLSTKESPFSFSVGIELKSELSLIGLIKLPTTLRIGYERNESLNSHIIASLSFSSSF